MLYCRSVFIYHCQVAGCTAERYLYTIVRLLVACIIEVCLYTIIRLLIVL